MGKHSQRVVLNETVRVQRIDKADTLSLTDIAFEVASWVSVEFKLYLIKEFQRLQEAEQKQPGWDMKRNLTKINYRIHTDAIQANASQLFCLANLENLNALFINEG